MNCRREELFVALGSVFRNAKGAQIIRAQRLVIHPRYLSSGGRNDIGIIKLITAAKIGIYLLIITFITFGTYSCSYCILILAYFSNCAY